MAIPNLQRRISIRPKRNTRQPSMYLPVGLGIIVLNGRLQNITIKHVSCLSKKKLYHEAETTSGKGINAEWGHSKCSYRRAMARLQISFNTNGSDLPRIRDVKKDVINSDPRNATRKFLFRIKKEEKRPGKRERTHSSSGLASVMTGSPFEFTLILPFLAN